MSPIQMAKIEAVMRTVLDFNQAFNRHDLAGMMRLMSDDCILDHHQPAPDGRLYSGKEAVTRFWEEFFRETPGAHIEIEEIFGLGERCVMRWKYQRAGEEGAAGYARGVDIFRVTGGLIHEKLSYIKG
jgi:predicted SnoaL-like aldol condensation-catalyzing enzyme